MRAVGDRPGHYKIIVTNYLESGPRADQQGGGNLGIFRKRDNVQMLTFSVRESGQRKPVIYANEFCAEQRNLRFIVVTFEADVQLDPSRYSDDQGYYISYQNRNRNGGINNISNPLQTGYTFYLEFPALLKNNLLFENSSPRFGTINGEYICIGEPFTFPFGGTDPDGDELRYSMINPLNQKGTGNGNTSSVLPAPYPDVNWLPGFSAANAIPGTPSLSVNAQTGELAVTATQLGLFVFAVNVEEFRNGVKIGEVRRDFQFLVIDCPPQTTPDPATQIKNKPMARNTTICQGDSAILLATANPNWNYQWQRDGVNLTGATGSSMAVRESGLYTVVVSSKAVCSKVGNSEGLVINVLGSKAKLSATGHLCATTGAVTLKTTTDPDVTVQWYRNSQPLAGQTSDSIRATEAGKYWSVMTYTNVGCTARSDTATLDRSLAVQPLIQSTTGFNRICPQDSLGLEATGGIRYTWQRDGASVSGLSNDTRYRAAAAGTYVVTAIDVYGCEGTSPPIRVTQLAPVVVTFDSIPGVCGPDVPVHTLTGSPPGGDYAGTGVTGNEFSAKQAGIGNHQLTYTVKAAPECAGTAATRTAVVAPIPTIGMPASMTTYRGNTFTMNPVYTGNPNQFQWTSGTYLDDAYAANPSVMAIGQDIRYILNAQNSTGCAARDTIDITVYAGVWVPNAFTPNGDGQNDTWELFGIEAFPDAIVTVFNRWGEVIFHSEKGYPNPFDGTLNGVSLPMGLYPYVLRTVPEKPIIRGSLVLIR
ncbi:hypothetical protein GCM10027190_19570 [Spirosoma areae]